MKHVLTDEGKTEPVQSGDFVLHDENLWLEDIEGEAALDWVARISSETLDALSLDARFAAFNQRLLSIYQSQERIAVATVRGAWLYNFWQDKSHPRGIWRKTTLESYASDAPDWQILLDVDRLAQHENENWVWAGASMLYPEYRYALLSFSRGGGDAAVVREFDCATGTFVAEGFVLAEAKSQTAWIDRDQIFVATDFGEKSLTDSGYPRIVKCWQRGTPLAAATTLFEGEPGDVLVTAHVSRDWSGQQLRLRRWVTRRITFQKSQYLLDVDGTLSPLDLPEDADIETFGDQLLVIVKSAWQLASGVWPQGSVLAIDLDSFLQGDRRFSALFTPGPRRALKGLCKTRSQLWLSFADNLAEQCERFSLDGGTWQRVALKLDSSVSIDFYPFDADQNDDVWVFFSGAATPTRVALWQWPCGAVVSDARVVKRLPALFRADDLCQRRFDAVSADGTLIPYVVVGRERASAKTPTLLYGYGGFEISLLPLTYNPSVGALWLEEGGNYVVAGLRGGGEFGPGWHLAATRENKQRCFDDFIAVAKDLIARGICSAQHLGIQGGSNGGLLVGAVMMQEPELFAAVVCQVPLLDMRRYHLLLAGASWVAEYGDPDDARDWAFISAYSPYQHVQSGVRYPRMLVTTSTRDDRVHPGHARKMVARLRRLGCDVLYYENTEGGHAGAANAIQQARIGALAYTFLWQTLG